MCVCVFLFAVLINGQTNKQFIQQSVKSYFWWLKWVRFGLPCKRDASRIRMLFCTKITCKLCGCGFYFLIFGYIISLPTLSRLLMPEFYKHLRN